MLVFSSEFRNQYKPKHATMHAGLQLHALHAMCNKIERFLVNLNMQVSQS